MDQLDETNLQVVKQIYQLSNDYIYFPVTQEMVNIVMVALNTKYGDLDWSFETNTENTLARISFKTDEDKRTYIVIESKESQEELMQSVNDTIGDSEFKILDPVDIKEKVTLH